MAGAHRRELVLGVPRQVARFEEQLLPRQVRRIDQLVAALEQHVLDEAAQLELQHRALGVPEDETRPDEVLHAEQVELPA